MSTTDRYLAMKQHPTWQQWLADCLLSGMDEQAIVNVLMGQGLTPPEAKAWIGEAQASPFLASARHKLESARKYEWLLQIYEKTFELSQHNQAVGRVSGLSNKAFLEQYYSANRPIILTDLTGAWPALAKWTPEYLKERFGDIPVEIYQYDGQAFQPQIKPFAEYVEQVASVESSRQFYMTAYNTHKHKPLIQGLLEDIDPWPAILNPGLTDDRVFLWYGPAGTLTGLHFDITNVLLVQVSGRKRVRLIPPYYLPYLYAVDNGNDLQSQVNPEAPDLEKFPLFKQVRTMELVLAAGEALFIPIGWWHQVQGLERSISLSFTNFTFPNQYSKFSRFRSFS